MITDASVVLRCTEKVTKLLGVRRAELIEPALPWGSEWYVNLLWLDRRKNLLFTNADTMFSFLAADIRKGDVIPIGEFFVSRLEFELATEELPTDLFGKLAASNVQFAKTADRRVLGTMNDLAVQWDEAVYQAGGHANVDVAAENRRLRRMPMGAIGMRYAIDLANDLLSD